MLTLDFSTVDDEGRAAVDCSGERHLVHARPADADDEADLVAAVAAVLPTLAPERIADFSLAQLHATLTLAAIAAEEH